MPRYTGDDVTPTTTTAPAVPPGTPATPGPGEVVLPTGTLPPLTPVGQAGAPGLHGKARWDLIQGSKPGVFDGPIAYKQWLASLSDDPNDPEFSALLNAEKQRFERYYNLNFPMGIPADVQGPNPYLKEKAPKVKDVMARWQAYAAGHPEEFEAKSKDSGKVGPTGQSASGAYVAPEPTIPATIEDAQRRRIDKELDAKELAVLKGQYKQPVFRGRAIGTDEIYTQGAIQDPDLQAFLSANGIALQGDQRSAATRSGNYVYMGKEHSAELNVDRDVYMFVDDAKAASMKVDGNKISKYQSGLGLTVTGKMDGTLLGVWYQAVEQAQLAAVADSPKLTVEEWFDLLMTSKIASKNSGAGAGAPPLEANDYYRAMMQVLGDISGVQG